MVRKYLSVTALTKYIKQKLETDPHLHDVWLKGEISNFNHHSRGHMYLTIKDDQASVRAVMFAGTNRNLKFVPENGMEVLIRGEIGVFEPFGQYQLYIQQMEPDGLGALHLAYEQLKEKLSKKGLFDQQYKQSLPSYPEQIGIITSPTGAAVRDIISTIQRRYPLTQITIIPAIVQGQHGAKSICEAIQIANDQATFDVLIVGRGGGSIEDLWNFNEEKVAEAIFASNIPIISAVGHETDQTIADYVADFRAPTPTAAAEIAVPDKQDLLSEISQKRQFLHHLFHTDLKNLRKHLQHLQQSYAFRYPDQLVKQKEQELDRHHERLVQTMSQNIQAKKEKLANINTRLLTQSPIKAIDQSFKQLEDKNKQLCRSMDHYIKERGNHLALFLEKLTLLNPLEIMKRGFAVPYTEKGTIISSRKQVAKDDLLEIQVKDGRIDCQVLDVKEWIQDES